MLFRNHPMTNISALQDIRSFYDHFNAPVTGLDCGAKCAPFNPSGKPFCCDICQAVPVAYQQEWDYLKSRTDLWHEWRGDECVSDIVNPDELKKDAPEHLFLLACKGPAFCEREYRASSCRQFPFFPYITSKYRFIGLAYYWDFEPTCWVLSNLGEVMDDYRQSFISIFDEIFNYRFDEYESYAAISDEMREFFRGQKRRFPVLHRNGGIYLVSPESERITRTSANQLPRFGVYK
jgi:hypothetical protein